MSTYRWAGTAEQQARRYETFWPRVGAGLIDGFVLMPFNLVGSSNSVAQAVLTVLLVVVAAAYFIPFHATSGQTLGKRVSGVRVVAVDNEECLGWRRATIRSLPEIALALVGAILASVHFDRGVTALGALALVWLAANVVSVWLSPKSRALHDLLASSVTIRPGVGLSPVQRRAEATQGTSPEWWLA